MSESGWIIKKGTKHLHGYRLVGEEVLDPKWLNKKGGALLFSLAEGRKIAKALGGVLIKG